SWVERPGSSLLVSVLLRPALDAERLHLATAVMALAAVDACQAEAGVSPDLKWPNDLLLAGRKLAGILAETVVEGRDLAVVVGLGLNVSWPADGSGAGPPSGGVALSQAVGFDVDRALLLVALLGSLEDRYGALADRAGQSAQATEYRRRCVTVGQLVRIDLADETVTGTAADVTPEGHLLVDIGMCLRRVMAGDVVHLRQP
ncbi:MAG: biotin--[acetyl-CoA-carboxylase] ligase, partial [Acidimicrobiales bacterium]